MTTIPVELLPCPFCGGNDLRFACIGRESNPPGVSADHYTFSQNVSCRGYGMSTGRGPRVYALDAERAKRGAHSEAIKMWNRRALLAEQPQAGAGRAAPVVPELTEKEREDLLEFHEAVCCDAGHRVEKEGMRRLAEIGAVESVGFGKHRLTEFGVYLLGLAKPAPQHDQGDEVRRLREALEGMLEYFPEGASDGECFAVDAARAALTHSQQGAEE